MKINDLSDAYYILQQIKELEAQRGIIDGGAGLNVTIQSHYQDDGFVESIRPHAIAEIERRIEKNKETLINLGVSFS